jgi:hypothetical protein
MVLMRMPDGTTCEYWLQPSKWGLRLTRSCVSYDLATMLRNAGWRIQEIAGECAETFEASVRAARPSPDRDHHPRADSSQPPARLLKSTDEQPAADPSAHQNGDVVTIRRSLR